MSDLDHSSCGPSSLEKRLFCPGSRREEEGLKDERETDEARDSGVTCHAAMEHLVKGLPLPDLMDKEYTAVTTAVARMNECLGGDVIMSGEMRTKCGGIVLCERNFRPLPYSLDDDHQETGTLDLAIHYPGSHILMLDWKFGGGFVNAPKWNLQMKAYALALWTYVEMVPVNVAIVQPAAVNQYDTLPWVYEVDQYQGFLDELSSIVRNAYDPAATCHVGQACKFCRAKMTCQTRLSAMGIMGSIDPDWKKAVAEMTLEERARFLTGIKAMISVGEGVIEYTKDLIRTYGRPLPGWSSSVMNNGAIRLAPKPSQPSWPSDSIKAVERVAAPARITGLRI